MIKHLYAPNIQSQDGIEIGKIFVERGARVRANQTLCELKLDSGTTLAFQSPSNGWVTFVAIRPDQKIAAGDLLFVIDVATPNEYRPDEGEFNPETELGKDGRRALEREGERTLGDGFSDALFEAPESRQGLSHSSLLEHPFAKDMKEGVPPKMSGDPAVNDVAQDKLADEASRDPELQQKLSAELQQQLDISPGPSSAPTPSRG